MKLRAHWQKSGLTQPDYADWMGIPKNTMLSYLSGHRTPTIDNLALIEAMTGGQVRARDFADLSAAQLQRARDAMIQMPPPARIRAAMVALEPLDGQMRLWMDPTGRSVLVFSPDANLDAVPNLQHAVSRTGRD